MAEDASSKKFLVSNFNNYKMVDFRPIMKQFNELLRILGQYTQHGLKIDESISVSSVIDKLPPSWKDFKHTLKHDKDDLSLVKLGSHLCIEEYLRAQEIDKGKVDAIAWWIDSGATTHVCKDRCWFKTYKPVEHGFVLYMGDDHFALIHGKGSVALEFSSGKTITLFNVLHVPKLRFGCYNNGMFMLNLNKVSDDSDSVYMSSSTIVNFSLWHARLGHVHYKRMLEMSKDNLIPAIDENPEKLICVIFMLHLLWAIKRIIHETTAPYKPQQNGVAERTNKALKKMVNSMLSYSGLGEGFWGESMLTACYLLNMVPNKRNKTTPYELWYKKRLNLSFLRVWGCRAIVRLPDPKRKTLCWELWTSTT
ncbi:zinc finger, CCHC-type containing protein [Tanacetum coccineum]